MTWPVLSSLLLMLTGARRRAAALRGRPAGGWLAAGGLAADAAEPAEPRDAQAALLEAQAALREAQTALREAQAALDQTQARHEFALEAAGLGQWSLNLADHSAWRTLRHDQIFGYEELLPEWTYEMFLEHVVPEDRAAVDAAFQAAVAGSSDWAFECRIRRADGLERWIWSRARIHRNAHGQVDGMLGIVGDASERKRTESALKEAQSRQASALAAGEIGTWEYDATRGAIYADENLARMFRVSPEEADGGPIEAYLRAICPDDRERVLGIIGRTLASGDSYEAEYRLSDPDGSLRWVVARGRVERAADGRAVRLPGVIVDVTALRMASAREQLLLAEAATANARFRAFFEKGALFAAIADLDGTIIEPNRSSWEYSGYTREQVTGVRFWEGPWWTPSKALMAQVEAAVRTAASGKEFRAELPYYVVSGRERFVSLTVMPIRDESGAVSFLALSGTDITARKRVEDELRASEEARRLALDAADLGSWHLDSRVESLVTDERFQLIFSGALGPIDYKAAGRLIHPDDRARVRAAIAAALNPDDPVSLSEQFRVIHPGSEESRERWVFAKGRARFVEAAGRRGLLSFDGTVADVTDQKRMESDLHRFAAELSLADRRKDEFLATLAHELRNPLAPITNALGVLRLVAGDRAQMEAAQSMIERQVGQMVRLVDDLMDVSRITRDRLTLRKERVDLASVIASAIETSRPLLDDMGHELVVALPDAGLEVDADPTRLAQVFLNLLNNASKYSERGARIELTARQIGTPAGTQAEIEVRDRGIGMSADQLPRIFEMFAQIDQSLGRAQGGLGIGLALVRRLLDLHGGRVEARSEGLGKGSAFVVTLPLAQGAASAEMEKAAAPAGAASAPRRILVVDDNEDGAHSLATLLRLRGHETSVAFDAQSALAAMPGFQPDTVLLDIGLPDVDGYETCRRMRSQPGGAALLVIAVTGWGQESDRRRSVEAGFDHHLVKPVDANQLLDLLASLPAHATSQ